MDSGGTHGAEAGLGGRCAMMQLSEMCAESGAGTVGLVPVTGNWEWSNGDAALHGDLPMVNCRLAMDCCSIAWAFECPTRY